MAEEITLERDIDEVLGGMQAAEADVFDAELEASTGEPEDEDESAEDVDTDEDE